MKIPTLAALLTATAMTPGALALSGEGKLAKRAAVAGNNSPSRISPRVNPPWKGLEECRKIYCDKDEKFEDSVCYRQKCGPCMKHLDLYVCSDGEKHHKGFLID